MTGRCCDRCRLFRTYQKAFAEGDHDAIVADLMRRSSERAKRRAAAAAAK